SMQGECRRINLAPCLRPVIVVRQDHTDAPTRCQRRTGQRMVRILGVRNFGLGVILALAAALGAGAGAGEPSPQHHALSLLGAPKFGPDFTHFDWVNPDAPKGGRVRGWAMGTFDSLNPFPVKGNAAVGLPLIYERLMVQSPDEAGTSYGLIAEW